MSINMLKFFRKSPRQTDVLNILAKELQMQNRGKYTESILKGLTVSDLIEVLQQCDPNLPVVRLNDTEEPVAFTKIYFSEQLITVYYNVHDKNGKTIKALVIDIPEIVTYLYEDN